MDDEGFDKFRRQALSSPDEMKDALEKLKKLLPYMIEYVAVQGAYRKAKFDSLMAAGFTEKQALELCKEFP